MKAFQRLFLVVLFLLLLVKTYNAFADEEKYDVDSKGQKNQSEIFVSTATAYLKSVGYHLDRLEPIYDGSKEKWRSWWLSRKVNFPNLAEDAPELIERNYEVVYFSPKQKPKPGFRFRGAGIWVFMDGNTKEIIKVTEDPN